MTGGCVGFAIEDIAVGAAVLDDGVVVVAKFVEGAAAAATLASPCMGEICRLDFVAAIVVQSLRNGQSEK